MIPLLHRLKLSGSVLEMGIANQRMLILDSFYNLYEVALDTFQFKKSLKITKSYELLHKFGKSSATSQNNYVVLGLSKTTRAIVLKVEESVEKVMSLAWHKADISIANFSRDGCYLATGGEDGRTLIYQVPSFNLLSTLPPRPDYICGMAFSPDSSLIAVSCFDRSLIIFDLKRSAEIASFTTKEVVEDLGFFNENGSLFFVCKDGSTGVFNIKEQKIISEKKQFQQWLTCVCITEDGDYAYIGTRDNFLHLVRTKDNQPLASAPTEHMGIASMILEGNRLFIGYADGYIEILELDKGSGEFEAYLKINDLIKAKTLAENQNIFLKTLPFYAKKLDELWKDALKEAIDLLARDRFQEALVFVSPFMDDPRKKEEFSYYTEQREFVAQFLDALERDEIAEAYKVAENHQEITKIVPYEKLEAHYHKTFEACKKMLADDAFSNLPKAQELLKPFINVRDKKEAIYMLLHNSDKYLSADNALKERNFVEYFRLSERFPFLKDTETYKKTYFLGQQIVQRIALLENEKNFEKAIELAKFLGMLAPFKNLALERVKLIEKKRAFLEVLNAKELKKAYALADSEESLRALPEFIKLLEEFSMLHERAYALAYRGNSKDTLALLEEYLEIPYWQEKIASTMRIAYLYEIKTLSKKLAPKEVEWGRSLEGYVERFGKDDELATVCEACGLKQYFDEITSTGDPHGYQTRPYLSSIVLRIEDESTPIAQEEDA